MPTQSVWTICQSMSKFVDKNSFHVLIFPCFDLATRYLFPPPMSCRALRPQSPISTLRHQPPLHPSLPPAGSLLRWQPIIPRLPLTESSMTVLTRPAPLSAPSKRALTHETHTPCPFKYLTGMLNIKLHHAERKRRRKPFPFRNTCFL